MLFFFKNDIYAQTDRTSNCKQFIFSFYFNNTSLNIHDLWVGEHSPLIVDPNFYQDSTNQEIRCSAIFSWDLPFTHYFDSLKLEILDSLLKNESLEFIKNKSEMDSLHGRAYLIIYKYENTTEPSAYDYRKFIEIGSNTNSIFHFISILEKIDNTNDPEDAIQDWFLFYLHSDLKVKEEELKAQYEDWKKKNNMIKN